MKNISRFSILVLVSISFQMCTLKSNEKWKSEKTNLELNFNDKWELILPNLDTDNKTLVGIKDNSDNSSLTVKITDDIPKEQLSNEYYFGAIKEQMLNANSENLLVAEDKIEFNGTEYHRLIFFMTTKFGEMTHTVYTHRNGKKVIGIQYTYPKNLIENPTEKIPLKIEEVLNGMKL